VTGRPPVRTVILDVLRLTASSNFAQARRLFAEDSHRAIPEVLPKVRLTAKG